MNRGNIQKRELVFRDRFIQTRETTDLMEEFCNEDTAFEHSETGCTGDSQNKIYKALVESQLLGLRGNCLSRESNQENSPYFENLTSRMLTANKLPSTNLFTSNRFSLSPFCGLEEAMMGYSLGEERVIPKTPYKVLDAPSLQDDFYIDVVHWSHTNVLAVGLGRSLYLWEASSAKITKLLEPKDGGSLSSVAWSPKGDRLAVGSSKGLVELWDYPSNKMITSERKHEGRVGTMSWSPDGLILSTGSRDKKILYRDIRAKHKSSSIVSESIGHKQEVCGVKWSPDGQYMSSGGNDNKVLIWSRARLENPCLKFMDHKAAVKALAWSNYQNGLLATGGGTADKCIKLWDVISGKSKGGINTGSQVCNMVWGKNSDEIVTTHGYSKNTIMVWKGQPLRAIAELPGHLSRVLFLAQSPDGQSIVTGSGDETLRFWEIFPPNKRQLMKKQEWGVYPSQRNIR